MYAFKKLRWKGEKEVQGRYFLLNKGRDLSVLWGGEEVGGNSKS